jgi:ATP-binding cassette subfamily B protein
MKLLFQYVKKHKALLALALVLAAINQCFSLCDSIITGKLINDFGDAHAKYGNDFQKFTSEILALQ